MSYLGEKVWPRTKNLIQVMCAPSDRLPPFKLMLRFVSPAIDEEFAFLKEFEKGEYRNHTSMDSYKNIHSKYCNRIY